MSEMPVPNTKTVRFVLCLSVNANVLYEINTIEFALFGVRTSAVDFVSEAVQSTLD